MKVLLALTLVLCITVVIGESNGRRRSQRRRPPAEIPENLEQDKPESGKEKDVEHNEAPQVEQPKGEKKEQKQQEVDKPTDAEEGENEKKKNQTTPLSQLFVPRATRRPRPPLQGSRRPRPTLPSFIRNSNRQAVRTSSQREDSSEAHKSTSAPTTSSRATKATPSNSGRRRSTSAPSSGTKRFGQNQQNADRSSRSRGSS